jgi:hypothetical protein
MECKKKHLTHGDSIGFLARTLAPWNVDKPNFSIYTTNNWLRNIKVEAIIKILILIWAIMADAEKTLSS